VRDSGEGVGTGVGVAEGVRMVRLGLVAMVGRLVGVAAAALPGKVGAPAFCFPPIHPERLKINTTLMKINFLMTMLFSNPFISRQPQSVSPG
jgi:hypothetical protein